MFFLFKGIRCGSTDPVLIVMMDGFCVSLFKNPAFSGFVRTWQQNIDKVFFKVESNVVTNRLAHFLNRKIITWPDSHSFSRSGCTESPQNLRTYIGSLPRGRDVNRVIKRFLAMLAALVLWMAISQQLLDEIWLCALCLELAGISKLTLHCYC